MLTNEIINTLFYDSREDSKVSHYIINKMSQGDQARYRIGDQMFNDLPALLNFYKVVNVLLLNR